MRWWDQAMTAYQVRGYLVITRDTPDRIGEVVDEVMLLHGQLVELPQPFRIVEETTEEDYLEQHRTVGQSLEAGPPGAHFYRMVTE